VYFGFVHGLRCFFIEPHDHELFFQRGHYYGSHDDMLRFAFFSKAAMEYLLKTQRRPDVIHTHDWQTGLVPVLLYEMYGRLGMHNVRACHSIHNFAHQGVAGENVLWATGLCRPDYFFHRDRLGDDFDASKINLSKGAIVYSNFVTTVSPRHAWEVRHTDQGKGLGHTLHVHGQKFGGVLNGLDYHTWNPEIDPLIPCHFSSGSIEGKYENKRALRERLWLRHAFKPVVAYAGRLDKQKGVHLIHHTIFYALEHGAQFVLIGSSPDPEIASHFARLKQHFNDHPDVHLELAWDNDLAHLIFAGSDLFVMPSMFEPCGLAQLIAMRYGTVPIVRAVGGLADTVFDRDFSDRPMEQRNGYVFHENQQSALESAVARGIGLWFGYPTDFRSLMVHGMRHDYSWARPGQDYINIYEHIRHR
jgi:starch synthase